MLFFAIHTYYATVITLLAAEIVTFYTSDIMPSYLGKLEAASGPRLGEELRDLHETGGIFGQALVQNFLEGDFFGWYLEEWNDSIAAAVRAIIVSLRQYDASTFQVEPDQTRDLLKKLYQYLLPKKLRHDLGEYYTPDWLAELVLNEVGYDGDLTKRILDPACGSGTFLALEIRRAREWAREKPWNDRETLDGILSSIVGFDLNPLAVITARTNYLIALGNLLRHRGGPIEIPVYLCDAVLTPSEARQVNLLSGRGYPLETAVGTLRVPTGLATQSQIANLARLLEESVRGRYRTEEFLERARRDLGLSSGDYGQAEATLTELYGKLCQLAAENRNGIWARIIKNFFAPVFAVADRKFDYLAGNLPWINWESLPDAYRRATAGLWADYGMAPRARSAQFELGSMKRDLSALFLYVAADRYLAVGGHLGFLVTQTLLKSPGAGDGFRRFELPARPGEPRMGLRVTRVHDLVAVKPFEGATNRTAAVFVEKGRATRYPVPYVTWSRLPGQDLDEESPLEVVRSRTSTSPDSAHPVSTSRGAPWISGPATALRALQAVMAPSHYTARAGSCTWLNGVYWVQVRRWGPEGFVEIANMHDTGRTQVPEKQATVETGLLYPLLRGRDVTRWAARPEQYIIVPHHEASGWEAIPEGEMRTQYPGTLAYLRQFEPILLNRSGYRQLRSGHPYYILGNTGAWNFAPFKVVWREVAAGMLAAVCGPAPFGQRDRKPAMPDHTVVSVRARHGIEGHYLCAALNSAPSQLVVRSYLHLHASPHVLRYVKIPRFDSANPVHLRLSDLSQAAHEAAARADDKRVAEIEAEVDEAAAELWGLTPRELAVIQKALRER